jgi:predicted SAM-dependent methyltransferase
MQNLFNKRKNHLKEYLEFNKIEQPIIKISELVVFATNKAQELQKEGKNIKILELGTKRSQSSNPTHKKVFFKDIPNLEYIMTDYQGGLDVDVVCDLHKTSGIFDDNYFDIIISCSTFEHLKYPQLCSHNLMKMLKVGGIIYIQTHQTYPLHGYKYDYYRFSREALKSTFSKKMNMKTISTIFNGSCVIIPEENLGGWNDVAESYLNVIYVGEKIDETPEEYIYDIDDEN